MLIPQFTIRRLLGITASCGLFFLVLSFAVRRENWAIAVAVSAGALILSFLIFAIMFLLTWWVARTTLWMAKSTPETSPFAQHVPPPQIIPPEDVN